MMSEKRPPNALGQQLRIARRALGMSQRDAAAVTGLSCPYLCQVEKGQVQSPSLQACLDIAAAYKITIEQIAAWVREPFNQRPVCGHCGQEIDDEV
jgi:transcriptional regulator with XRE-family HTH domain